MAKKTKKKTNQVSAYQKRRQVRQTVVVSILAGVLIITTLLSIFLSALS